MVNVSGSRSAVADAQRDMARETQLDEEKMGMEDNVRIEAKHDYSPVGVGQIPTIAGGRTNIANVNACARAKRDASLNRDNGTTGNCRSAWTVVMAGSTRQNHSRSATERRRYRYSLQDGRAQPSHSYSERLVAAHVAVRSC